MIGLINRGFVLTAIAIAIFLFGPLALLLKECCWVFTFKIRP
jgi:hypothetical protein